MLIATLLSLGLITRIRYRVGSRHVKVLLFGVCIRRIPYAKIEAISKRRGPGWAEHWLSTLKHKHRLLVIRRKGGLFKNFMITPKNRYVFKTELERAMQRAGSPLPVSQGEPLSEKTKASDEGSDSMADSSAPPQTSGSAPTEV